MLIPALLLAGLGGGALVSRRLTARAAEREAGSRLVRGVDGIVEGARPIRLQGGGAHAALLLHGLGDTPQAVAYLADYLHGRGFTVHAPLLPGHGRSLREFAASDREQWIGVTRAAYDELAAGHSRVGVVGLSMGGALASILAAEREDLPALVLLAPYLATPPLVRRLARLHALLGLVVPYVRGRGERSVKDDRERPKSRAYGYFTPRLLNELAHVADRATAALPHVRAPTLLIQSREDNRIHPAIAARSHRMLGAHEKQLVWTEGNRHVITVDFGRERVFQLTAEWLETWLRLPARAVEGDQRARGA